MEALLALTSLSETDPMLLVGSAVAAAVTILVTSAWHTSLSVGFLSLAAALVVHRPEEVHGGLLVLVFALALAVYFVGEALQRRRAREEIEVVSGRLSAMSRQVESFCSALERRANLLDEQRKQEVEK